MNVLVYAGEGTTPGSVHHTISTLRDHLEPYYAVNTVNAKTLASEPWQSKTSAVVFPGGADLPYTKICNGVINSRIRDFVTKQGGIYIGFCAGGYYGAKRVEFAQGDPKLEVTGNRELGFYPGIARGPAFPGFQYNNESGSRAAALVLPDGSQFSTYFNGGATFVDADKYPNVEVIARFMEPLALQQSGNSDAGQYNERALPAAVVISTVGKGKALLTGPHPEFSALLLERAVDSKLDKEVLQTLRFNEKARRDFMHMALSKVGLNVNTDFENVRVPSLTPMLAITDARHKSVAEQFYNNLLTKGNGVLDHSHYSLTGESDQILLFKGYQESYSQSNSQLKHREPNTAPKSIIFAGENEEGIISDRLTPHFDSRKYFKYLSPSNSLGSLLLYGEVVTSTSTFLNSNKIIMESIPPNTMLHVGTIQVSGRGRGGNMWVNPKGVAASTAVVNLPLLSPITGKSISVVFFQYLGMLALCQAIKFYQPGCEYLPVKIKWPNDLYIMSPVYYSKHEINLMEQFSIANPIKLSEIEPAYVKISGLLVNTHFINNSYCLLLGCGLNLNHDGPTTSLRSWIDILNKERADARLEPLPYLETEKLQALYMNNLQTLVDAFLQGETPKILNEYYKNWLHSDQIVTLADHNTRAKIVGITTDYGFLIAKELQDGCDTNFTGSVYHLQPDGNTFDIFKGLIAKKSS